MTQNPPFSAIGLPPERSAAKPRKTGLTMMADWGMPLHQQEDILGLGGRYVDFAKIVTGTARLYERRYLTDKLALYKSHQVRPFIGGQFFEYVLARQGWEALPAFFDEAVLACLRFTVTRITDDAIRVGKRWQRFVERREALEGMGRSGVREAFGF